MIEADKKSRTPNKSENCANDTPPKGTMDLSKNERNVFRWYSFGRQGRVHQAAAHISKLSQAQNKKEGAKKKERKSHYMPH